MRSSTARAVPMRSLADRPHRVLAGNEGRVHELDLARVERDRVEPGFDRRERFGAPVGTVLERHARDRVGDERAHPVADE